jgi:hypothetical protein
MYGAVGADGKHPGAVADLGFHTLKRNSADVLGRDGAELSATETRRRNLANADHLAVLHAIWTAETQAARHDRYRELVMAALPPGHRSELSHRARWLFRTLHAAELADLDPPTSSAPPSPPGTWPDPAISPPSWTPGSARAPTRCSPSPKAPGPGGSPSCPTRTATSWPRQTAAGTAAGFTSSGVEAHPGARSNGVLTVNGT